MLSPPSSMAIAIVYDILLRAYMEKKTYSLLQDEFAIGYADYASRTAQSAISMAFVAPPITPRDTNPAYRVYEVDPDTYEIMDSVTYTGDINEVGFQEKRMSGKYGYFQLY